MEQRKIAKIIVHCSDTPTGRKTTVKDIDDWHKQRGFSKSTNGHYCGYHWVICVDGVIEMGRLESDIGAHCEGHNSDSIGVCLVGRGEFNRDQFISLFYLLSYLVVSYNLSVKDVFGHYELNNKKSCPMIGMNKVREELEKHIQGGFCHE